MRLPLVAIVGRPNVGKSSLFNRLLKRRLAVVDEISGVTRDRNYATCEWAGVSFRLIDTGGIVPKSDSLMEQMIFEQAEIAIDEADLVLLVVDVQVGIHPIDRNIARTLAKGKSNNLLVVNKTDHDRLEPDAYEFLKLGLGEPLMVSATGGRGIGELLDETVRLLPPMECTDQSADGVIRTALVGRPNVGKSSFINKLIGHERNIVTPIAGTTRDAIDTPYEYRGRQFLMIDTAGLRRRFKVRENLEFYTNLRTNRAIEDCDVAILVMDAVEGITSGEQRILDQVLSCRRAAVIAVNKWDLVEKDTHTADLFTQELKDSLTQNSYLPVVYISALTGQRLHKVMEIVEDVYRQSIKRIATSDLNDFIGKLISRTHPPARQGKHIKIHYVTQSEISPPTFVFFSNHPRLIAKSYISFLTNNLRRQFGFAGVPIRLKFKKK